MRKKEIYEITKKEIKSGKVDLCGYAPIMYELLKQEDYEAMEGIRLAIADYGMQIDVPQTDEQMEEWYRAKEIEKKRLNIFLHKK
jgi:hypothetical protein